MCKCVIPSVFLWFFLLLQNGLNSITWMCNVCSVASSPIFPLWYLLLISSLLPFLIHPFSPTMCKINAYDSRRKTYALWRHTFLSEKHKQTVSQLRLTFCQANLCPTLMYVWMLLLSIPPNITILLMIWNSCRRKPGWNCKLLCTHFGTHRYCGIFVSDGTQIQQGSVNQVLALLLDLCLFYCAWNLIRIARVSRWVLFLSVQITASCAFGTIQFLSMWV